LPSHVLGRASERFLFFGSMAGNAKMSLRTPNDWHQHSNMNMTFAANSQLQAHQQMDSSRRAHQDCFSANLNTYSDLHHTLENKVQDSNRLVDKLQSRSTSVQNSISNTMHSLAQVEAAHQAKEAPLNTCSWRIDQRERRPLREQVRDPPEIALEQERAALLEAQRKLADAAKRTRNMIARLQDTLQDLNSDISDKRQALAVDDMCLRTQHRVWQVHVERPGGRPSSGRPGSGRRAASMGATFPSAGSRMIHHEDSSRNETGRQNEAHRHSQIAANTEQQSKELRDDNQRLIDRCENAAQQACSRTERSLQERVNENQLMRRNLENEIKETNNKIDHTKTTISQTRNEIKSLEEPLALVATRDSWRKQRALREQIKDPVSTRLEDQKLCLIHTSETLRQHRMDEKTALTELQHNRERLKEDLRDKTAALHIDLNCLSNEAHNWNMKSPRPSPKNRTMAKSMNIDPIFSPSGGTFGGFHTVR